MMGIISVIDDKENNDDNSDNDDDDDNSDDDTDCDDDDNDDDCDNDKDVITCSDKTIVIIHIDTCRFIGLLS